MYFAPTKVWITDSDAHPFRIEWLRYADDSDVPDCVKDTPHVGFEVESIEEAGKDLELVLGPLVIDESKTVAFFKTPDGGIVELMKIQ